jgi:hypothetical protein
MLRPTDWTLCDDALMRLRHLFPIFVACIALASCGGGGSGTTPPPAPGTGSATLSWVPPAENTDGSSLTNLSGFRIYHGMSAAALDNMITVSSPGISSYVVDNLAKGTHYFAVSAVNTTGAESDRSPTSSKIIP